MTFGVVVYGTRYSRGRAQALPLFFFELPAAQVEQGTWKT